MTLFVKNMVCARCIRTVTRLLESVDLPIKQVSLGEATLLVSPSDTQLASLRSLLTAEGFELLDDRNSQLIAQVKSLIINEIHHQSGKKQPTMNFSDFLSKQTGHEYSQLSKLFSSVEGLTIEKYIIAQKIERVKELLVYGELNFSEIAWQTGYSSSQYLSNQFRQVTGLTPTRFKAEHKPHSRKPLDAV